MGENQDEQQTDPEEQLPRLAFQFRGPDSTSFSMVREGVNAWQLMALAMTLRLIAEIEIGKWHLENVVAEQARKPSIAVPGAH
jgi:hypothetical protein